MDDLDGYVDYTEHGGTIGKPPEESKEEDIDDIMNRPLTQEELERNGDYIITMKGGLTDENKSYLESIGVKIIDSIGDIKIGDTPEDACIVIYVGSDEKKEKVIGYKNTLSIFENGQVIELDK